MHRISSYKDGYKIVPFCLNCGKEAIELSEPCEPLAVDCPICGHNIFAKEICKNCQKIREKWQSAVDKQNDRN